MKKFKWYTGQIGAMKEIEIEVSPNTTPDDLRAIDKGLCEGIIKRREYYKGICEQMAAVDYGGSYKAWLIEQLEEHGKIMWRANSEALMAYMAANEYRKICLAELARLEHPTPDTAAGNTTSSGEEAPPKGLKRHFDSQLPKQTLTGIFNTLKENKYLPTDSKLSDWLWICTGEGKKAPKEPLKWLTTGTDLAIMIELIFGNERGAAEDCFIYIGKDKQWKAPKKGYLANRVNEIARKNPARKTERLLKTVIGQTLAVYLTK